MKAFQKNRLSTPCSSPTGLCRRKPHGTLIKTFSNNTYFINDAQATKPNSYGKGTQPSLVDLYMIHHIALLALERLLPCTDFRSAQTKKESGVSKTPLLKSKKLRSVSQNLSVSLFLWEAGVAQKFASLTPHHK